MLPHSNAEVERIFSYLNNVKTKLRNRMENKMCISILAIKFGLLRHSKCCSTYELPNDVLRKIGTLASYSRDYSEKTESCH